MIFIILLFMTPGVFGGEEIKRWIQEPIEKSSVNFRIMNGTHKFGSSSSVNGANGVVQIISSEPDVDWLINEGNDGPYVAVFKSYTFNEHFINPLLNSGKISGMVVITVPHETPPSNFSFDSTCPNQVGGIGCNVNPYGNSFLMTDWPVPLVLVDNFLGMKAINDCYTKFNLPLAKSQESRPLCSLHMKNHMFAAENTEVCMRRGYYGFLSQVKYCDPLGGQNIVLPMGNYWKPQKKVSIVTARFDVASMFDGVSPGAMSSVTGIVTLLTTAHILKSILPRSDDQISNSVLFTLMNGEAYEYIGSSRIVYDLGKDFPMTSYPLSMEEIDMFIDISQLSAQTNLYLHTKNEDSENYQHLIETITNFLKSDINVERLPLDFGVPTSYQTFYKENNSLPGLVLTNYKNEFKNRYYHGLFDNNQNIQYVYMNGSTFDNNSIQEYLSKVSSSLAVAMYQYLMGNNYSKPLSSHASLVDELLHCFLDTNNCKYMNAVITKDSRNKNEPESLYVGVVRGSEVITKLTGRLLALLTSDEVQLPMENCTNPDGIKPYHYVWMNGLSGDGVCISTTLKFTPAESPAFLLPIDKYNWTSGQYPTWSESTWLDLELHLFLKPPRGQEYITLSVGLVLMALSFVVVYFLNINNSSPARLVSDAQI